MVIDVYSISGYWCLLMSIILVSIGCYVTQKKRVERKRNKEKETLMRTAKVRMQTQTGSELPDLLICTKSATLTTHRTNTHTRSDLSTENDLLILGSTHQITECRSLCLTSD
jgi:hypothetical protein